MRARIPSMLTLTAVLAIMACSGNPMPGDRGYPYNTTGIYEAEFEAMGVVYSGPAEITTSPGGLVYGTVELSGPETVVGDFNGRIAGDTLTFESSYERGGCTGLLSGQGIIAEGGGSVAGDAVADDDCAGDVFDAVFTMSRRIE